MRGIPITQSGYMESYQNGYFSGPPASVACFPEWCHVAPGETYAVGQETGGG